MPGHRIHRIRRHYEARVSPHRAAHDILDWSSRESQERRFDVLLDVLRRTFPPPALPRLLDVGCGMTDLASYLEGHGLPVRYVGTDITFAILAEARRRHPQRTVLGADVFAAPPFPPRAFDACYCSGVFNLSLGNNDAFAVEALPRLLALAGRIAVANFLHRRSPKQYEHCHYFDPETLAGEMSHRGLRVLLIDDYLENDFTLVLSR
jgi:SAM-dependent methyltransferase